MIDTVYPAPADLGDAGAELWREMVDAADFADPSEREMLHQAAALLDTAARLAAELDGAPLTVAGSRGQSVPNPLLAELRLTRAEAGRLLARLRVVGDVEPAGKMTRSESARVAARARWSA